MRIGMSSSCFYPEETESSLRRIGEAGAKTAEIFFNSPSELHGDLLRELCAIKAHYGMDVVSVHPFMSFAEGFWLFSEYERRFRDSLEFYPRFFEAAQALGAHLFVLHGAKHLKLEPDRYAERLFLLNEKAKPYGVQVAHENVVYYVGEDPAFMQRLRTQLGRDFAMVLDLKQAYRAGADPFAFIETAGDHIVHVHISDSDGSHDCLPPGRGAFPFLRLFRALQDVGYNGKYIIELYRHNFRDERDLSEAQAFLRRTLGED